MQILNFLSNLPLQDVKIIPCICIAFMHILKQILTTCKNEHGLKVHQHKVLHNSAVQFVAPSFYRTCMYVTGQLIYMLFHGHVSCCFTISKSTMRVEGCKLTPSAIFAFLSWSCEQTTCIQCKFREINGQIINFEKTQFCN